MLKTNTRVFHVGREIWMRAGQVERAIENNRSFVWVTYGETFRDATYKEAMEMRNAQPKVVEPFPFAELPGLIFRPSANAEEATRREYVLAAQANRWVAEVTA